MLSLQHCNSCSTDKPAMDFYKSVPKYCKACVLKYRHNWIANNPNARIAIRATNKKYRQQEPEAYVETQARYEASHKSVRQRYYLEHRTSTRPYKPRVPMP